MKALFYKEVILLSTVDCNRESMLCI